MENESTSTGSIQLSLYDITSLKTNILGQKIELDKILHLNHAGLRVHGIEFHFGYENLISICEIPDEFGKIRCTNERNPEFWFDVKSGKLRIKERLFLKFGRIVSNIKDYESYHLKAIDLEDEDGKMIRTHLCLDEIIGKVLNHNLRLGQQQFPLVEQQNSSKNLFKIHFCDGKCEEFELPKGVKSVEEWNAIVAKLRKMEQDNGGQLFWTKFGTKRRKSTKKEFGHDVLKLYQKLINFGQVHQTIPTVMGPFAHGSYDKMRNNCADFAKQFVTELCPRGQKCNWPREMRQLRVLGPVRFANKIYRQTIAYQQGGEGQIAVGQILREKLVGTANAIGLRLCTVGYAVIEAPKTIFIEMPQFLMEIMKINSLANI